MRALAAFFLLTAPAAAYDSTWCHGFSAEAVTVYRLVDPDYRTATPEALALLKNRVWAKCLNSDEPPHFGAMLEGIAPAEEDRVEACRREYRTFRESDMTVIRRNSGGKRVPCPL